MNKMKEIKLKLRDAKNKLTGKQKIIDEYNNLTSDIAHTSDNEENPEKKDKLMNLYGEVTRQEWESKEDGSFCVSDHNPYNARKKETKKLINIAKQGLAKINRGR